MTELTSTPDQTANFLPAVRDYLDGAAARFADIPAARQADLAALADHVRSAAASQDSPRLTFICTHNSRRSHLGQIWAQLAAFYYGHPRIQTFSGGTEVTAMNPRAVAALQRCGLQITTEEPAASNPRYLVQWSPTQPPLVCFSKVFGDPANPAHHFAAILTCAEADGACPVVPGATYRAPIRYEDPKLADGTEQEADRYDQRSAQICTEMLYLMSLV
jgi:arsenate reductase